MSLPAAYVGIFPILSERARALGYALTLHGSLARDMDILAMPWTEKAVDAATLVAALKASITFLKVDLAMDDFTEELTYDDPKRKGRVLGPEDKPHGRKAWCISLGAGAVIDISVVPREEDWREVICKEIEALPPPDAEQDA
jgi:hypothetical protein